MTLAMRINLNATGDNASSVAIERGWDLYQMDGFWYVNNAKGDRRPPGPSKAGDKELGSGPSMNDAMKSAIAEHTRRESEKQRADQAKRATAAPTARPGFTPPIGSAGAP